MAGSGRRTIQINTQERAISPDINRLQAFAGQDDAELFRFMFDAFGNDDLDAGALVTTSTFTETPLRAEIINGLLVRPQPTTLALLVDPGVLYAVSPDGAADASVYKYVRDAGVTIAGSLLMIVGGGGPRVDVIECRINAIDAIVPDNRDIFDPTTGLFTAQNVTKERSARLEYRVRAGIVGAGFPGVVSGWLPLAVALVPAAAPNVDTMTFWDVRPLLNDRAYQPFALTVDRPIQSPSSMVNCISPTATTGRVAAIHEGRRVGGRLRSGGGSSDLDSIDVTSAGNQDPGFALLANRPWHLYLLTPYGLPRWARYTGAGIRVPRSPRGIPTVSMTVPTVDGKPSAPITPASATGLGVPTSSGVCVAAGYVTSAAGFGGFYGDNSEGYWLSTAVLSGDPMEVASSGAAVAGTVIDVDYTLTAGLHFPRHARTLLVEPRFQAASLIATAAIQRSVIQVFGPNGGPIVSQRILGYQTAVAISVGAQSIASSTSMVSGSAWITLPPTYPTAALYTIVIRFSLVAAGLLGTAVLSNTNIRVLGWKF